MAPSRCDTDPINVTKNDIYKGNKLRKSENTKYKL